MLHCFRSSPASTAENINPRQLPLQDRSGSQSSPSLTNEYTSALQTSSYSEIRIFLDIESDVTTQDQLLSQYLRPNGEYVEEILQREEPSYPSYIAGLLWSFFDHSENKAHMCLDLSQAIRRARNLITPLQDLLLVLPLDSESDSLSSPQRTCAFDLLLKYEQLENPFPNPGSRNVRGMRDCFQDLNEQLQAQINKANARIKFFHRATLSSAVFLILATIGVIVAGILIASHALIALSVTSFIPICIPKMEKKERLRLVQLDAAQRGAYVLHEDIITIERLVNHLYSDIEVNKKFIRNGLWRGKDMHSIMEVSRQIKRSNVSFQKQLTDLDEHLCLSFAAINRARSHLIQAISAGRGDRS